MKLLKIVNIINIILVLEFLIRVGFDWFPIFLGVTQVASLIIIKKDKKEDTLQDISTEEKWEQIINSKRQ